jgi:AcrR family transcriptional regulator
MPRPRFARLEEAKKQALLDAAAREFAARDYESASINRILDESGFSKGSFYHYFDDKADLAATLLLACYLPLIELLRATPPPRSAAHFWSELREQNLQMTALIEARPPIYELTVRLGNELVNNPDLTARVMTDLVEVADRIAAQWRAGQALGMVRTDLPIPELLAIQAGLKRELWRVRFPAGVIPTHAELTRFVDDFFDLLQRTCRPARAKR